MKVRVLLFAWAKSRVGFGERELELGEGACAGDVLKAPELSPLGPEAGLLRLAVNEEFAAPRAPLREGDVVAVLPPMSGG